MNYPIISPALVGPAMLAVLKKGKKVERITVWFTYGQLHRLFSDDISKHYPLEIVLAEGRDMEKRIDCRLHVVPWNIDIRTAKEKKAARMPFVTPDPTPPAPDHTKMTEEEQKAAAAAFELLDPFCRLAESEYRQLTAALRRKRLLSKLAHQGQAPTEDTAHAQ